MISPRIGHGHDPIAELGGHYVMMNAKTRTELRVMTSQ